MGSTSKISFFFYSGIINGKEIFKVDKMESMGMDNKQNTKDNILILEMVYVPRSCIRNIK